MHILMADQKSKKLAEFLNHKRAQMIEITGAYTWRQMALDIGLTEETMRRLKGKKPPKGVHLETLKFLILAFGEELYQALELPLLGPRPTFDLRLEEAKRKKEQEG